MRRFLKAGLAATALAATLVPMHAHASAAVGYQLIAKHSGKCLTAPGSVNQAYQYDCVYGSSSQTWYFESLPSGWYQLRSAFTGYCLDVSGSNSTNGTAVLTYGCNGHGNQSWSQQTPNLTTGYGEIRSQINFAICLDITSASLSNGAGAIIWQCNSGNNQQWLAVPISAHA